MSKILTPEEVYSLTGSRHKKKQCQVLDDRGILYVPRADGWPAVTWNAVDAVLAPSSNNSADAMIDFGAINNG